VRVAKPSTRAPQSANNACSGHETPAGQQARVTYDHPRSPENLRLGVEGKVSLWKILNEVSDQYGPLESLNLEHLIERADAQRDALERERIAAGKHALGEVAT